MIQREAENVFRDTQAIHEAIRAGRRRAIAEARQLGRPLVVWREGRVAWVDPVTFDEVPRPTSATTDNGAD